jgi:peptidoglycan/LPS O-acetylase OafA/YrhL
MTTDRTPVRRPQRLWLLIGGVVAALGIALLWPLQNAGEICAMIYPAPPGCGAPEPKVATFTAIALIIAAFAAMVVVSFTALRPRLPLMVLTGVIVGVALLAAGIIALSQTGIWDPYQPPVIVN